MRWTRTHVIDRLRIVVSGLIASLPFAGLTLHYLQYVLGLRELGHDVLYLEDVGGWYYEPQTDVLFDPWTEMFYVMRTRSGFAPAAAERHSLPYRYLRATMDAFGLADSWTFVDHQGR